MNMITPMTMPAMAPGDNLSPPECVLSPSGSGLFPVLESTALEVFGSEGLECTAETDFEVIAVEVVDSGEADDSDGSVVEDSRPWLVDGAADDGDLTELDVERVFEEVVEEVVEVVEVVLVDVDGSGRVLNSVNVGLNLVVMTGAFSSFHDSNGEVCSENCHPYPSWRPSVSPRPKRADPLFSVVSQ